MIHAVEPPVHEIAQIERAAVLDVGGGRGLDRRRDLVDLEIRSGERRLGDHIHLGGSESRSPSECARDGRCGLHVDRYGLRDESGFGNLQPVAAREANYLSCKRSLRIRLKIALDSRTPGLSNFPEACMGAPEGSLTWMRISPGGVWAWSERAEKYQGRG